MGSRSMRSTSESDKRSATRSQSTRRPLKKGLVTKKREVASSSLSDRVRSFLRKRARNRGPMRQESSSRRPSGSEESSLLRRSTPSMSHSLSRQSCADNASRVEEVNQASVLERPTIRGGEPVWQSQIMVPRGGVNHSGKTRVFTIRGPPRKTREHAARDAKQLTKSAAEGSRAVRQLANQLHQSSHET